MGIKTKVKVVGGDKLAKQFKLASEEYRKGLSLLMWRALGILEAAAMQNIRKNFTTRTGALLNSMADSKTVTARHNGMLDTLVGTVGPEGVKYARIQEEGGTIYPVRAKWLWIPIGKNRPRSGIPKMSPSEFFDLPPEKRVIHENVVFLASGGKKRINKVTPIFVLKKMVKIHARPYMRPALEKNASKIADQFGLFLDTTFKFND